jgi:hypothetical protein
MLQRDFAVAGLRDNQAPEEDASINAHDETRIEWDGLGAGTRSEKLARMSSAAGSAARGDPERLARKSGSITTAPIGMLVANVHHSPPMSRVTR